MSLPTSFPKSFQNRPLSPTIGVTLCGLLLGLSAPGYGLWILAWIALIPALIVIQHAQRPMDRFRLGCWLGGGFGALYYLWFFDLHPLSWLGFGPVESRLVTLVGWFLLTVETAGVTGLCMALSGIFKAIWVRAALLPLLWVLCFALLNLTPLALPWAQLEYTQTPLWPMRLLAGVLGGSGLAGLIVLHNSLWAARWLTRPLAKRKGETSNKPYELARLASTALPLIFPLGLGLLNTLPEPNVHPKRWPIPVAVVQGNLPIETIRSAALDGPTIIGSYINPIQGRHWPEGTLLVYPEEGVAPGWAHTEAPDQNRHLQRLMALAQQRHFYIAVGVSSTDPQKHRYNSLALITPEAPLPPNRAVQFYHKRRLVPFGEFTPYHWGESLSQILHTLNVDYSTPYDAGWQSPLLQAGSAKLGGLLCFELIDGAPGSGGFAQRYEQQGADLLINSSNLGWFHQNPLMEAQFLAIGQMRAAETHLPLVIASNTGISAIVSNQGKILQQTHPNREKQAQSQILFYNGG